MRKYQRAELSFCAFSAVFFSVEARAALAGPSGPVRLRRAGRQSAQAHQVVGRGHPVALHLRPLNS